MSRNLAIALTALAVLWIAILVSAPVALRKGGAGPAIGAATIYASSSRICHQRPERSFALAGTQLPVCARCFGLYLSGALATLLAWAPQRRRRGGSDRVVLLACAVPTALTWGLEVAGLVSFSNTVRALAALPLGAAAGWIFVRALRDEAAATRGTQAAGALS